KEDAAKAAELVLTALDHDYEFYDLLSSNTKVEAKIYDYKMPKRNWTGSIDHITVYSAIDADGNRKARTISFSEEIVRIDRSAAMERVGFTEAGADSKWDAKSAYHYEADGQAKIELGLLGVNWLESGKPTWDGHEDWGKYIARADQES